MNNQKKLFISQDLDIGDEKILLIGDFINFCSEMLPIRSGYKVYLVSNREPYSISTTAAYIVGENEVRIYVKGRALVDILRSIAHEMTHMMQDEQDLLGGEVRDAGGFHEDQANARAGELIKLYAKKPGRKRIYESIKSYVVLA
jgi:hypothetical protein